MSGEAKFKHIVSILKGQQGDCPFKEPTVAWQTNLLIAFCWLSLDYIKVIIILLDYNILLEWNVNASYGL